MPCPAGVDIPGNFAIWNEGAMYDIEEKARKAFKEKQEAGADAGLCIQCGKCEKVCPQGIGIRKDLADVVKDLSVRPLKAAVFPGGGGVMEVAPMKRLRASFFCLG